MWCLVHIKDGKPSLIEADITSNSLAKSKAVKYRLQSKYKVGLVQEWPNNRFKVTT